MFFEMFFAGLRIFQNTRDTSFKTPQTYFIFTCKYCESSQNTKIKQPQGYECKKKTLFRVLGLGSCSWKDSKCFCSTSLLFVYSVSF
jgi:hypothetical protein